MISERRAIRSYARMAERLKERIIVGEFEVGTCLPPERELSIFYDVSRPTIREALIALEIEGIVSVRRGSGAHVISRRSKLGESCEVEADLFEILQARRAMGSEACALAAPRITAAQLEQLDCLVQEMRECHDKSDVIGFGCADRQFCMTVSEASENTIVAIVTEKVYRVRSLTVQQGILENKMYDLGGRKSFGNYQDLIAALRLADDKLARLEWIRYYNAIIESILNDMEEEAVGRARENISNKRDIYLSGRS